MKFAKSTHSKDSNAHAPTTIYLAGKVEVLLLGKEDRMENNHHSIVFNTNGRVILCVCLVSNPNPYRPHHGFSLSTNIPPRSPPCSSSGASPQHRPPPPPSPIKQNDETGYFASFGRGKLPYLLASLYLRPSDLVASVSVAHDIRLHHSSHAP